MNRYPDPGGSRSPRSHGGSPNAAIDLPKPQPVTYFDQGKKLRPALVDTEAEEWAQKFKEVATSQLRRFYETVMVLRRRLEECDQDEARLNEFQVLRPEFKMLKAKAAYTVGRETGARRSEIAPLLQFFVNHTAAVNTIDDFTAFVRHFEAVIAFHKYFKNDKGSR